MFILVDILDTIIYILELIIPIYIYIIIARAIVSWVNPDPYNPIVRFLHRATEPVLFQVRRRLPDLGSLDISPFIVILILLCLKYFSVKLITHIIFTLTGSNTSGVFP